MMLFLTRKAALCILLVSSFLHVFSQQDTLSTEDTTLAGDTLTDQPEVVLGPNSSPRKAVANHLIYLQEGTYYPGISAQSLDSAGISTEELMDRAIKLKQIYDAEGYIIDTSTISNDPDYTDSLGRNRYVVYEKYPDIYLQKYEDEWKYSYTTVRQIPRIHEALFPFGSDLFLKISPQIGQQKFLGLKVWQYQGILILIALSVILYGLLGTLFNILIRRILPRFFDKDLLDPKMIRPVARPLSLLLVAFLLFQFYKILLLPVWIMTYISTILKIIMSIFGVIAAYRLVDLIAALGLSLAQRTETTMDEQLIPLVKRVLKIVVGVLGVLFVLQNLNVNVTALLAGISIGGLAIALAAQDTVKNFIGSITIFIDRPFQMGDFIETDKVTGSVIEIGVRSTRIRALEGAYVAIPNGGLANLTITNHGIRTYRRYATTLSVTYDTPPALMEQFVKRLEEIVLEHPSTRKSDYMIYFHEMGDSALQIFFAIYLELTGYGDMLAARQDIFLAVMKAAEELGIKFAFPSTSVYLEQMPPDSKAMLQDPG